MNVTTRVKTVANCSDGRYNLPQFSLPGSDIHYNLLFTVYGSLSFEMGVVEW